MTKIVQSYLSTIVKGDFSIIEMRIFLIIVKRCKVLIEGKRYTSLLMQEIDTSALNTDFHVPFKAVMGRSHNYGALYNALSKMQDEWKVEYYNSNTKTWYKSSWINNVVFYQKTGIISFSVPTWLIDYICDCTKYGYRYYDFENAMSLRNANAARLYLITCSITKNWSYDIEGLKEVLGLKGKYASFSAFERRVLKPVMKELEQKNLNGFKYIVSRTKGKYSKPKSITFVPIKRERSISSVEERKDYMKEIPSLITQYLYTQFNFSYAELAGNKETFKEFTRLDNWQQKLFDIADRTRRKCKNHGYMINALKSEINKSRL